MEGRILRCSGHLQEEVLMWEEEIGADGCSRCTGGRRMFVSSEDEEEEVERRREIVIEVTCWLLSMSI